MATFFYRVRDKSGKVLKGRMDAADERELRRKLDERDYFIIEYTAKKSEQGLWSRDLFPSLQKVKMVDISVFSWQLYTMLDAGMTLINSLKSIHGQTHNITLKNVLENICQDVEQGKSFSEALKKHPRIFSRFYIQMVNAGEVGGVLDEMIRRLAVYYEVQAEIRAKVASAMIYPFLLLVASLSVIIFLVVFVLPQFSNIFRDIGVPIPPVTQTLLDISNAVRAQWFYIVALVVLAALFIRVYITTREGRYYFDKFKLRIPIIGVLIKKSIATRFTQTLATLTSGGIPILTALDVVIDTMDNVVVERCLGDVTVKVGEGKTIAEPLAKAKIFPDMVINMISVGEEAGSLEKMLDKISTFYAREMQNAIMAFTKMVEPVLMMGMALIIGFISLSIFMPLAGILKGLH